jgi:hypothetical protein
MVEERLSSHQFVMCSVRSNQMSRTHGHGAAYPAVCFRSGALIRGEAVRRSVRRRVAGGPPPTSGKGDPAILTTLVTIAAIGAVRATALTPPLTLGLPVACGTRDRLMTDLHERPAEAGGPLPSAGATVPASSAMQGCAGARKQRGAASGLTPHAPKHGGHRDPPHDTTCGEDRD